MRIVDCKLRRYELPLVRPITIGGSRLDSRTGLILTIVGQAGVESHGEIAPLPGLHSETLVDAEAQIKSVIETMKGADIASVLKGPLAGLFPSVRCGLEMALMDLSRPEPDPDLQIPVCALLMPGCDDVPESVGRLSAAGYSAVKIKVGRRSLDEDIRVIRSAKKRLRAGTTLRLDANRAWSLDQAIEFCSEIGADSVEYIEEPVRDAADHEAFILKTDFPLALDETIAREAQVADVAAAEAIILKPSVLGGFSAAAGWVDFARRNGARAVMSCCFESSLSIRAYALFAIQAGIADAPLGIDTLKFFSQDLLANPPLIAEGAMISSGLTAPAQLRQELLCEVPL